MIASCAPIEDKMEIVNTFDPDNIQLTVEHSSPGSNYFTLKMTTPGVTGYWDYTIGKAYGDEAKVLFPITGKQTFKYVVSSAYIPNGDIMKSEIITKTIDVDIQHLMISILFLNSGDSWLETEVRHGYLISRISTAGGI